MYATLSGHRTWKGADLILPDNRYVCTLLAAFNCTLSFSALLPVLPVHQND
ncbi:hypothetical protein RABR111495_24015 [Rahnella bruchi]